VKHVFVALIIVSLLAACAPPPTPIVATVVKETVVVTQPPPPTYTPYPTWTPQEPLPTYTPYPTWTPWPTFTLPPTEAAPTPPPTSTPTQPAATVEPTSTPPPAITDWRGEYYGNRDLAGLPVLVRNDVAVSFEWGGGAPAAGLPADDFSARWTRDVGFEAATFRFHVFVDGGVRLWIDDDLIVNDWYDSAFREATAEYATVKGQHNVQLEYYEGSGQAQIRLWWERVTSPSYPDWKAEYWPNSNLDGAPALVRNEQEISFYWGAYAPARGLPADNFAARWSRQAAFESGAYRFYAWSDDGVRLFVDGNLFLNEWHDSGGDTIYTIDMNLSGAHKLEVEYYEHTGQAQIKFWWREVF
jgi:hypothetical protein